MKRTYVVVFILLSANFAIALDAFGYFHDSYMACCVCQEHQTNTMYCTNQYFEHYPACVKIQGGEGWEWVSDGICSDGGDSGLGEARIEHPEYEDVWTECYLHRCMDEIIHQ